MLNQTARITIDTIPQLGVEIWQLDKDCEDGKAGQWRIKVSGTFYDRESKADWVKVTRYYTYQWPNNIPTKMQLAKTVKKLLVKHLEHEIYEGLWIDGERVFDPH